MGKSKYLLNKDLDFGCNIRNRRQALHLKQVDLAVEAGISRSTVSKAESSNRASVQTLVAIAKALECTLDDLVSSSENPCIEYVVRRKGDKYLIECESLIIYRKLVKSSLALNPNSVFVEI